MRLIKVGIRESKIPRYHSKTVEANCRPKRKFLIEPVRSIRAHVSDSDEKRPAMSIPNDAPRR